MLQHLQALVEDTEVYCWRVVRDYHAAWLQQIEQGWAAWGNENKKIKLRRLIVWHRLALGSGQPSNTPHLSNPPKPRDSEVMDTTAHHHKQGTWYVRHSLEVPVQIFNLIHLIYTSVNTASA